MTTSSHPDHQMPPRSWRDIGPRDCGLWWHSPDQPIGTVHCCLLRAGHDGPHWCCEPGSGYPGGTGWSGETFVTASAAGAAR